MLFRVNGDASVLNRVSLHGVPRICDQIQHSLSESNGIDRDAGKFPGFLPFQSYVRGKHAFQKSASGLPPCMKIRFVNAGLLDLISRIAGDFDQRLDEADRVADRTQTSRLHG